LEKIGVRDYVASTRPGEPSFIPATGRDAYQTLAKDIGYGNIPAPHGYGNNPAGGASQMLADAGIPGIRYLDQGSRPPRGFAQTQDSIAYYKDMLSRHPDNPMLQQQLAAYQADLAKAQQGTYNYVIFDPNIIDIKRKYALPGAIGAGGMGALATQDNYQPQ
jgi:hypothetical protein